MSTRKTTIPDIDQKIASLQKKREELTLKSALFLSREVHKFFGHPFEPELVLTILKDVWTSAPDSQKQEWQNKIGKFPETKQVGAHRAKTPKPIPEKAPAHASA